MTIKKEIGDWVKEYGLKYESTTQAEVRKAVLRQMLVRPEKLKFHLKASGALSRIPFFRTAEIRRIQAIDDLPVDRDSYSIESMRRAKIYFFHIPKCAGMTINYELYGCRGAGHYPRCRIERALGAFESDISFAVIRDPIERFCSAFQFIKKGGLSGEFSSPKTIESEEISDFVEYESRIWKSSSFGHFIAQSDWLHPLGAINQVDYLLPFESLRQFPGGLKVTNSSSEMSTKSVLTPKASELVKKFYNIDYSLYKICSS